MAGRKRIYLQWWMVFGTGTLLLLLVNSPWVRRAFPELWQKKHQVFGLPFEMNFAVWWSAVLYLLSAAIFYEIASLEGGRRRRPYIELALLMLVLMTDEMGSLHEWVSGIGWTSGIGGWLALAPFALVLVVLLGDSLRLLWRDRQTRREAWLVLAGFVCMCVVAAQEYAEHNLTSRSWSEWYGRFFEEGTELVGALLILLAAVYGRRGRRWGGPPAAAVPDPTRMARLLPIIAVGGVAHLAAAQALKLPVGDWHGNPAAVYPFAVFFVLACHAFWVPRHRPEDSARSPEVAGFWSAVAVFFLACSLGFVQNLWYVLPSVARGLGRRWFFEPAPIFLAMILAVWFIALTLRLHRGPRLLSLMALPLTMWIRLHLDHPAAEHIAAGLFALLCATVFLRPAGPAVLSGASSGSGGAT